MSTPDPIPVMAPAVSREALDRAVQDVRGDSASVASAIQERIDHSRSSGSVCMMGGWTAG